jgi:hypothetical protein
MKHKSQLSHHPTLDSEEVKKSDMDEQPRPTRKLGSTAIPSIDSSTTSQLHRRIKGRTRKR